MGLTKRADSFYVEFKVIDDGKTLTLARGIGGGRLKRWKVSSLNRTRAKEQESIIKTELMKGQIKSERVKLTTFAEWGEQYLGLEAVRHLNTYQDRVETVRKQLIPFFGSKPLGEITPADVEAFRAQRRLSDGSMPKTATVNADHAILKHALSEAVRRGLLACNPAKLVKLPDPKNERDRVLEGNEWERLHAAAPKHLKPILLTAYQLGQRAGEILKLTWDRVDLQRGFIRLRGIDTKNTEGRLIPLTHEVRAMLLNLAKVRSLTTNHVFLFRGKPMKRVTHAFNSTLTTAGITDLRFHDLRHCAATNLRRAGVDTMTAMRIVGHKSEKMHRRYNNIAEADLNQAVNRLSTYLSNTPVTPATNLQAAASVTA